MKRFHLAITLSASFLTLAGCSSRSPYWHSAPNEAASAQTLPPAESLQLARKSAWEAAVMVQHPPHPVSTWQQAKVKWRRAIRLLESVPEGAIASAQAKRKLTDYRAKYNTITQRLQNEESAVDSFKQAQAIAWQAAVTVQHPPHSTKVWQRAFDRWERALHLMATVPPLTTPFDQAQDKVKLYRANQRAIQEQLKAEVALSSTLEKFAAAATRLDKLQTRVVLGETTDSIGIDYASYETLVRSLDTELAELKSLTALQSHPAYAEMQTAIADYKFALSIWKSYLRHKQANAEWLRNEDFFNQLTPLALIDSDRLLQRYNVKVHYGTREAKVPLKFTVWEIWETAGQHIHTAQKKLAV